MKILMTNNKMIKILKIFQTQILKFFFKKLKKIQIKINKTKNNN